MIACSGRNVCAELPVICILFHVRLLFLEDVLFLCAAFAYVPERVSVFVNECIHVYVCAQ